MKLYKSLLLGLVLTGSVSAATISFDMAADTGAATSAGIALGQSYTAYIGTYTGGALTSTATFSQISPNFTTLFSIPFASGDTLGAPGYVTTGDIAFTDAAGAANKPLFVFYSNGSDQNALITGFGNIPADATIPNTAAFAINQTNAPTLTYVVGSYNANGTNIAGEGGNVVLNAVPEPSAALLGAIGVLALLRRRRA